MVKLGDKVKVEGEASRVVAIWGAGKHLKYVLADGRSFLDLHLAKDLEIVLEKHDSSVWDSIPSRKKELPDTPPVSEFDDEV